jgi:hypothetical protein
MVLHVSFRSISTNWMNMISLHVGHANAFLMLLLHLKRPPYHHQMLVMDLNPLTGYILEAEM